MSRSALFCKICFLQYYFSPPVLNYGVSLCGKDDGDTVTLSVRAAFKIILKRLNGIDAKIEILYVIAYKCHIDVKGFG